VLLSAITLVIVPAIYGSLCQRFTNCDPFVYASLAKDVMAGKRLYLEAWQDKPPLTFFFYALPQLVVPHSYVAIGVFSGLCIAIQGLLIAREFRRSLPAMTGCVLFSALFPMTHWDYAWPSTEHFANLFVVGNVLIAFRIVRDSRFTLLQCFMAGAFACAAFHVRQNLILCGVVPVLAVLLSPRPAAEKGAGAVAYLAGALSMWGQ